MNINYYLLNTNIEIDDALNNYISNIKSNNIFNSNIDITRIEKEVSYIEYIEIDSYISNKAFYYKNDDVSINDYVDASLIYKSSNYYLNEIKIDNISKCKEMCVYEAINDKEFKMFLNKFKLELMKNAYIKIGKNILDKGFLDIEPINSFTRMEYNIYYEKIYVFKYNYLNSLYTSIYSTYNNKFYKLDYIKSNSFKEYLINYKRPIVNIPNNLLINYFNISYKIYNDVLNYLIYSSNEELFKHVKKSLNLYESNIHKKYIDIGVYYFKYKPCLLYLDNMNDTLIDKILNSYLTLKYKSESGLFLYNCYKLNIINVNINEAIAYLKYSYKLGNLDSKAKLYEHYSNPIYFNIRAINKYR